MRLPQGPQLISPSIRNFPVRNVKTPQCNNNAGMMMMMEKKQHLEFVCRTVCICGGCASFMTCLKNRNEKREKRNKEAKNFTLNAEKFVHTSLEGKKFSK